MPLYYGVFFFIRYGAREMTDFDHNCFQSSYHAARQCLLDAVSLYASNLMQHYHPVKHPLLGPGAQPLFVDWFELGQVPNPENLIVLISGTHGVEGFAGSAIQCSVLPTVVDMLRNQDELGFVIIHAFNPWGFAWLRRYDHEGIDLNRNFIDFERELPQNPIYNDIHDDLFANASEPLARVLSRWQDKLGESRFQTAITQGQYQHQDGLFYGGIGPSWSRKTLEKLCDNESLRNARRIAVIDLHTGLGPYGYGEVINDHEPDSAGFNWATSWYGDEAKSALLGQSYSPPKTGLLDFFWHQLIGDRGCFVTLEFGTFPLDDLLLLTCREQRYHNSYGEDLRRRNIHHDSVVALQNFFYPRDEKWQSLILNRAHLILELARQGVTR